jgi:hypothetical protein
VQQIRPHLKPGLPFYSLGIYGTNMPFYIKRTVTLVEAKDELIRHPAGPQKWVPDFVEFSRRWREHRSACHHAPQHHRLLRPGIPMK